MVFSCHTGTTTQPIVLKALFDACEKEIIFPVLMTKEQNTILHQN